MSKQWYYVGPNDENVGPVKAGVIRERVADGTILPATMIWREGLDVWVRAAQIRKLWKHRRETAAQRRRRDASCSSRSETDFGFLESVERVDQMAGQNKIPTQSEMTIKAAKQAKHPLELRSVNQ